MVFRVGQRVGESVEIHSAGVEPGTCNRALVGFHAQDLTFWVSITDLVPVTTETVDLGVQDRWGVAAHPGAEIVDGSIVFFDNRVSAPTAQAGLSFTPRAPQGSWHSFLPKDYSAPGGKITHIYNENAGKIKYLAFDHVTLTEGNIVIDVACFTLSERLNSAPPHKKEVIFGSGGGGAAGGFDWVGRHRKEDDRVCVVHEISDSANFKADSVELCYDAAAIAP